jgi:3-dehydroquinate synthase
MKPTTQSYTITTEEKTDIVVGKNLLSEIATLIAKCTYTKLVIVTDTTPEKLFLPQVLESFKKTQQSPEVITIQSGEASKRFETLEMILTKMYNFHLDRKSAVIALGGGVVGDITTLAAGLYYRGIDCIQIPTTLLSQVDSSLGGKGAIDLGTHKNTIGIIKQPRMVIVDTDTITSLPKNQIKSGMGEVIKYAIAMDHELFSLLEKQNNTNNLDEVIKRCITLKMGIVKQDPQDLSTQRSVVNFGHTLGQAIELQTNLTHGEAIAIGMAFVIKLSQKLYMLSATDAEKSLALLKQYDLPISIKGVAIQKTVEQMKKDKKSHAGQIRFVLLEEIGKPKANCVVEDSILQDVLSEVLL